MANEKSAVRKVIRALAAGGFRLHSVDDGGETHRVDTEHAAIDHIFGVDDSRVYFQKQPGRIHWIYIVLGNAPDGSEVVCDYTAPRSDADALGIEFDRIIETVTADEN